MANIRLRFMGGPLNGLVVWMDERRTTMTVQVATAGPKLATPLEYRRDGQLLVFVPPGPDTTTEEQE